MFWVYLFNARSLRLAVSKNIIPEEPVKKAAINFKIVIKPFAQALPKRQALIISPYFLIVKLVLSLTNFQ